MNSGTPGPRESERRAPLLRLSLRSVRVSRLGGEGRGGRPDEADERTPMLRRSGDRACAEVRRADEWRGEESSDIDEDLTAVSSDAEGSPKGRQVKKRQQSCIAH